MSTRGGEKGEGKSTTKNGRRRVDVAKVRWGERISGSRGRQPFVDRSRAQVLRQCVLLSKGRRSFQHALQLNGGPRLFTGRGSSSVTGVISVGLPQPQIAPSAVYSLGLFTEVFSGRL